MTSSNIAIQVIDLDKVFRIYPHPLDPIIETITKNQRHLKRNALNKVNLTLQRGEIVGILGKNGAGKSTLLKIIAGTLEASGGELQVNGRLTAILELGTGFHPEYTGRENIYMGGLCLGMSRSEIDSKIDEIIDFSELREVIDQPFKTYSTGMQARLTFSTAISVDPEILIIDEALSVGDARFQMKCFSWLSKQREQNATILIVSHDTNTMTTFCDRAIILEDGSVFAEGGAKEITETYHNLLFGGNENQISNQKEDGLDAKAKDELKQGTDEKNNDKKSINAKKSKRYGTGEAVMESWGIYNEDGNPVSVIKSGTPFKFEIKLACKVDIPDISCGFAIKDKRGTVLWGMTNISQTQTAYSAGSGAKLTIATPGVMWLAAGDYFVTLGVAHANSGSKIDFIEDAINFRVIGTENIFTTSTVNLQTRFEINAGGE
jgi:ABC-type polysaccharide/polyol phosphate transport system ATPase subunit